MFNKQVRARGNVEVYFFWTHELFSTEKILFLHETKQEFPRPVTEFRQKLYLLSFFLNPCLANSYL